MTTSFLITAAVIALLSTPALWLIFGNPRFLSVVSKSSVNRRISIIIPARDEEANIEPLLASINAQETAAYEVIVVNDGSTDQTSTIAKSQNATVLNSLPLPPGWKGKPWACQQGADLATGDWYLFLDADVRLEENALCHLQGAIEETKAKSVISVSPYHKIKNSYEELSAFFNLLMITGINAFGKDLAQCKGSQNNSALFGQCMLISSDHYEQVGGHEVVKHCILENFHLAENLKQLGIQRTCYLGRKLIFMRMFPEGVKDLWNSWKKGFSSGAAKAAPRALVLSSIWISGAMFTMIGTFISLVPHSVSDPYIDNLFRVIILCVYVIYAIQCRFVFRKIGSFSLWNAILFPVSLLFYQTLFFSSIISRKRGKSTQWKGRSV